MGGVCTCKYLLMKAQMNFGLLLQIYFCKTLIISVLPGISTMSLYLSNVYQ